MQIIDIGGKPRLFRFSIYAIEAYCKLKNISLSDFYRQANEIVNSQSIGSVGDVLYAGLIGGANREHQTVDFTREDITDWMDDAGLASIPQVINAFAESLASKKKEEKKKGKSQK